MKKRGSVNIFILIDALGWEYIKERPFLDDIAPFKRSVKSVLGFSSGVIPSLLTGKLPNEHKHWSLYFKSPDTSPFWWVRIPLWLPKKALNSRIIRKLVEEMSKRGMGYTGYFETYLIPIELLHWFDISERSNIYKPKGIREGESIFDILRKEKVDYSALAYPMKDKEIFKRAINELESSDKQFYFLYCSEFDAFLHSSCKDRKAVNRMIDQYEESILNVYRSAKKEFEKVNLYVFSDHGMAPVNKAYDLKEDIEKLGLSISKDYIPFYDSTMARFWFFNNEAKGKIVTELSKKEYGRILSKDELKAYGCYFEGECYGQVVFLMNTGAVINPSFMGNKVPAGMHGFDAKDKAMDAMLVSNMHVTNKLHDVRAFFDIMAESIPEIKQKTKVLYFLNSLVRGGVEEHVLGLLKNINREEFEPMLLCPQQLITLIKQDLEKINVKYYSVCIRRWWNIKAIRKFLAILKQEKPDIVHSHLFFATRFAAPLSKFAGVPVVMETAHIREAWRRGIKKAYFIDKFFYRFVDKIIAVSDAVKEYLVNEKKLSGKKIEVIRNGVDLQRFRPDLEIGNNGKFKIGVIGRLEPQKGHRYFLEAVKMLDGKFKDVKFLIAGEGGLRKDLEQKCRELKIEHRVEFLGFRRDIVSVFRELDLVVLPSLYEGLPLVALEAGAMGKPVIATNVDGSPEIVVNNKTGFIVPSEDSVSLKEAIEMFLADRGLATDFGENARRHIEKEFELKKQVAKTERLYKLIVSNG